MLPQPSDEFRWTQDGPAPALVCRPLEPYAAHLFTSGRWRLGSPEAGQDPRGWEQVAAAMHVGPSHVVRVRQVHGAGVLVKRRVGRDVPTAPDESLAEMDIIISNDPAVAVSVLAADCVPVLIVDRRRGVVAAAHAGWRGLALSAPAAAVQALVREFGSEPRDLLAAAGPSIRACCYEVGPDVRGRFAEAGFGSGTLERWFSPTPRPSVRNPSIPGLPVPPRPGHWYFDSAGAARDQLEAAGIPPAQIFVSALCTASHPQWLCSYRRDRAAAGRMVGVIRAQA